MPDDVRAFLREAERRIEQFRAEHVIPGFVPSDHAKVYAALRGLVREGMAPGRLFCEWGSGFGVVAGLAAMLGFEACGIEVEGRLVSAARNLAGDFGLHVEFFRGSFVPAGIGERLGAGERMSWLVTEGVGLEAHGLSASLFDVIFAYPWPGEEGVIERLFEEVGRPGSVLVTHHHEGVVRAHRLERRRGGASRRRKG